jgi:hypothetical protein
MFIGWPNTGTLSRLVFQAIDLATIARISPIPDFAILPSRPARDPHQETLGVYQMLWHVDIGYAFAGSTADIPQSACAPLVPTTDSCSAASGILFDHLVGADK